jgi:hypothetical protein
MLLAVEPQHHSLIKKSTSIWRRLSKREKSPPEALPPFPSPPSQKLQRRTTEKLTIRTEHKQILTHVQRIEVPIRHPEPRTPESKRVLASDMQATAFPKSSRVQTVAWDVFLTPDQVYSLVMGFAPERMEDKWFVYSEGPDLSGKLKVHFHRSWTGMKIAELFVLIDLKGEGAGKIVGIKWNGSSETNGMNEEEAKYMISTTCAWVLGVNIEQRSF